MTLICNQTGCVALVSVNISLFPSFADAIVFNNNLMFSNLPNSWLWFLCRLTGFYLKFHVILAKDSRTVAAVCYCRHHKFLLLVKNRVKKLKEKEAVCCSVPKKRMCSWVWRFCDSVEAEGLWMLWPPLALPEPAHVLQIRWSDASPLLTVCLFQCCNLCCCKCLGIRFIKKKRHYTNYFLVLSVCSVQANAGTSDNADIHNLTCCLHRSLPVSLTRCLPCKPALGILQGQKLHLCKSSLQPPSAACSSTVLCGTVPSHSQSHQCMNFSSLAGSIWWF